MDYRIASYWVCCRLILTSAANARCAELVCGKCAEHSWQVWAIMPVSQKRS
jgi:hypothetical protein